MEGDLNFNPAGNYASLTTETDKCLDFSFAFWPPAVSQSRNYRVISSIKTETPNSFAVIHQPESKTKSTTSLPLCVWVLAGGQQAVCTRQRLSTFVIHAAFTMKSSSTAGPVAQTSALQRHKIRLKHHLLLTYFPLPPHC